MREHREQQRRRGEQRQTEHQPLAAGQIRNQQGTGANAAGESARSLAQRQPDDQCRAPRRMRGGSARGAMQGCDYLYEYQSICG
jgi:hypothetical protein